MVIEVLQINRFSVLENILKRWIYTSYDDFEFDNRTFYKDICFFNFETMFIDT